MSVEELKFDDEYFIVKQLSPDRFLFKIDVPYGVVSLDRNQAHLLKLWLEEHLK